MILNIREIVIRFVLAVIVGGIIGYERERQHRAAGFRTHILLSLIHISEPTRH
ncbi:MgtC/SapB family protein, partial [Clostridium tertium]|uniref:MgtC/SapB family protein n=1 Tax=Clostridium tertium TaxID=1559 RepID=UPI00232D694E